jgi:uncharacterized protein YndB with AHSA1/START domain
VSLSRTRIDASPRRVFKVLADPRSYAYWVVGSKRIRDADPDWPAVGSVFHHAVGFGPLHVRDFTRVEAVRPGRMIELKARARPLGTARVRLELRRRWRGTEVTMTEGPGDALSAALHNPVVDFLVHGRNVWSLERLKALAEGRVAMPADDTPSRWQFGRPATGGTRRAARRLRRGR